MKPRIVIRPAADRDLDEQAEYLAAHQRLETALRFYRAAEETFRLLASQPEMGRLTQYRSPVLAGMRMVPLKRFPKHLESFTDRLVREFEIVRILHPRHAESLLSSVAIPVNSAAQRTSHFAATPRKKGLDNKKVIKKCLTTMKQRC